MSWDLVERLRQRFPEVEPFPREGGEGAGSATERHSAAPAPSPPVPAAPSPAGTAEQTSGAVQEVPAAPAAPPTRLPPKREEAKAPVYMTPGAWIPGEKLLEIAEFVRSDPAFRLDYLSFVSAVDFLEHKRIEVVYHLYSTEHRHQLLLKVRVPRDEPRVATVTGIWPGADWHERETYDLLGVVFEGHPNLRRIMMTDDWVGHPLRKDYVFEDPRWLVELAKQRQQEIEGLGLGERA